MLVNFLILRNHELGWRGAEIFKLALELRNELLFFYRFCRFLSIHFADFIY